MTIAFENIPGEFISKVPVMDYKVPLISVLGKLASYGAVVLTKNKEYYGIISGKYLIGSISQGIAKKAAAYKYAVRTSPLGKETSVATAIDHFNTFNVEAMPYIESDKVLGVVRRESILKSILSMKMLSGYKASEIMSSPIISISPDSTISEALSAMKKKGIGRIALSDSGKLSGMLSYGDLLTYSTGLQQRTSSKIGKESNPPTGKASDIADTNMDLLGHNESADKAIRAFVTKNIHTIVVTRGGKPVGILTPKDILSAASAGNAESDEGIILSGIDSGMEQYADDIRDEVKKLIAKTNRFTKFKVLNIAVHVKKQKVRNYEIQARLWLDKRGAVSAYASGYSIEATTKEAMERLYSEVKNKKEIVSMGKKGLENQYSEED